MDCSREILIEVVRYWYPDDFAEDHPFDFVTDGMTPLAALQAARYSLRTPRTLGSPRRAVICLTSTVRGIIDVLST